MSMVEDLNDKSIAHQVEFLKAWLLHWEAHGNTGGVRMGRAIIATLEAQSPEPSACQCCGTAVKEPAAAATEGGAPDYSDLSAEEIAALPLDLWIAYLICGFNHYGRARINSVEDWANALSSLRDGGKKRMLEEHAHLTASFAARFAPEPGTKQAAIEWSAVCKPDKDCSYTHVVGQTPFGRILITWKGWKDYFDACADETPWGFMATNGSNIEECKREVEAEYNRRLAAAFTLTKVD